MNRYKLNYIVEYIRHQSEFPFDVIDVDDGVEHVLAYFGLHPELDDAERDELHGELVEMASEAELAEVARLVHDAQPEELGWIGQTVYPDAFMRRPRQKSVAFGEWTQGLGLA